MQITVSVISIFNLIPPYREVYFSVLLIYLHRCLHVSLHHSLLSLSAQSVCPMTLPLVHGVITPRTDTRSARQITVIPALITSVLVTLTASSSQRCLSSVPDAAVIAGTVGPLTRRLRCRSSRTPGATSISDLNPPFREGYFSVILICTQMNTTEYEQMMNDLNDRHDCESGLGFTPADYFNEKDPDLYSYDDILS